jgi:hypothetical protein
VFGVCVAIAVRGHGVLVVRRDRTSTALVIQHPARMLMRLRNGVDLFQTSTGAGALLSLFTPCLLTCPDREESIHSPDLLRRLRVDEEDFKRLNGVCYLEMALLSGEGASYTYDATVLRCAPRASAQVCSGHSCVL